jgi:iron complex outermembrane recepter protein
MRSYTDPSFGITRRGLWLMAWQAVLCAAGLALAAPAMAFADKVHFEIPAQAMPGALKTFAAQAHMQLLYQYKVVENVKANSVSGDLEKRAALEQLLRNSGLEAVYTSDSAATIRLIGSNAEPAARSDPTAKEGKTSSSQGFLVAQANPGQAAGAASIKRAETQPASRSDQLQEVVVTAQKRDERLQDVPVPVSVISTEDLVNRDQTLLRDYYASVPGLGMTTTTQSSQILSIRGIVTNPGNPTVGITVDDMPFGSSTIGGGGLVVPDFDPGDLARVEVLRGPQGTLYGASSLGGLLKFVTVDPSTAGVSGSLLAGIDTVQNSDQVGYVYRGAVNVPVSDTLALRASGFGRLDPGYIDNVVSGRKGVNTARAAGGMLSALWQFSPSWSLKLTALLQQIKGDGSSDVDVLPGLGDLQQNYIPGVGEYARHVQAYIATLRARLGNVDLVSITGYNINQFSDSWDYTFALGSFTQQQFGVTGTPISNYNRTAKFTQEIRLTSSIGDRFDWLLGGFYTHEDSDYVQYLLAADANTGAVVGTWCNCSFPQKYSETAAFADLTYHASPSFDIQLGARGSWIRQTFEPQTQTGPFTEVFLGQPSPVIIPAAWASGNPFTYLVTPRYRVSPDLMLYARFASGYQAGGTNQGVPGVPPEYGPSKTYNYELGVKTDLWDHRLSFDASLYYIKWKDIQLNFIDPQNFLAYTGNGTGAKSQGVELSVQTTPLRGLNLSAWITYDVAELTEDFPPAVVAAGEYGVAGDRLPFTSRYSGFLSVEQRFPLAADVTGFVGGDVNYVSHRLGFFTVDANRTPFGGYSKANLHAGVDLHSWTVNAYLNNVGDRRGAIGGGQGYFPPYAVQYIQPRTIGLNVSKAF